MSSLLKHKRRHRKSQGKRVFRNRKTRTACVHKRPHTGFVLTVHSPSFMLGPARRSKRNKPQAENSPDGCGCGGGCGAEAARELYPHITAPWNALAAAGLVVVESCWVVPTSVAPVVCRVPPRRGRSGSSIGWALLPTYVQGVGICHRTGNAFV